ncbi:MAG TPA: VOC family protein [Acidimicrobiia bacterium]|nr:VOC family protein [Acidimicrobiia bacterium]
MASVFRELVIDSNDPARLAAFWSDVLGWTAVADEDGDFWMSSSGAPDDPGPVLVFVAVPEPKAVKNRIHIDLNPSGCDQDAELQRLLALGAQPADVGQGEQSWVVLADPEGNEFCLLARRIDR